MDKRGSAAAFSWMVVLAACGGGDRAEGAGGSGAGGRGPTVSGSGTGVGSGAGAGDDAGAVTSGTTASSSGVSTTSSASTGGAAVCDGDIDGCGDEERGCLQCALAGPCRDDLAACQADAGCQAYIGCFNGCDPSDTGCLDGCEAQNPDGAALFNGLVDCMVCKTCPGDCDAANAGC